MPPPISLFSQSLFALPLMDAIPATAQAGYTAIELACTPPHFDLETAQREPERVADHIRQQGLTVSALSLFSRFTETDTAEEQIAAAETYIRLAPLFGTHIVKITPGPPGSTDATHEHWTLFQRVLDRLIPLAEDVGVRLACETHMRQLTDTLAGTQRLLDRADSDTLGLTVDFSNMMFAGENMEAVFAALSGKMYNTHVKNGLIDARGHWWFLPLDTGWTDYTEVCRSLKSTSYEGYITVECLGADARNQPVETVKRDLVILHQYLTAP
jgi:L-ribulose-5-phosphate 3-epimerase